MQHILTPPTQRAVFGHFGEVTPASAAFVVGGFGD